eukprot:IDg7640t1
MFDAVRGSQFFSKIDLKTGCHQIRVKPEHIENIAFSTKYGKFEFSVLPMGLCNAPTTFVALINEVLHGCIDKFCIVYLDDILIFSKTVEEHRKHVEMVLHRLRQHTLYASPRNCYFMAREVEFLGIILNAEGLKMNQDKIAIIPDRPSMIARPLKELTRKGRNINEWSKECDDCLNALKRALISAPFLI